MDDGRGRRGWRSRPEVKALPLADVRGAIDDMREEEADVVIVSHDRPLPLAALLGDLGASPAPIRSVTVVDDSSSPVDWPARFPTLRVRLLRPSKRIFISAAKNAGAQAGDAPFVAFVDDDNRLPVGTLAALVGDLVSHPEWGAVMPGAVYETRPDLVWVYAAPLRPDRWEFDLVGRNRPRDPTLEGQHLPTDALPNFSVVRRRALEQVGGFDEGLPVNSSADFVQRLRTSGWLVRADSGVLTHHDVLPPGVPGYWAEHTVVDPARAQHEVADWFRFHRRWGPAGRAFALRASARAMRFLLPTLVAAALRPAPHRVKLLAALARGYREGLFAPLPEPPTAWHHDRERVGSEEEPGKKG